MSEHLGGGKVVPVEEPVFGGANGALSISKDMPREFWEQLS
jgi:rod shape-determining protein MreB